MSPAQIGGHLPIPCCFAVVENASWKSGGVPAAPMNKNVLNRVVDALNLPAIGLICAAALLPYLLLAPADLPLYLAQQNWTEVNYFPLIILTIGVAYLLLALMTLLSAWSKLAALGVYLVVCLLAVGWHLYYASFGGYPEPFAFFDQLWARAGLVLRYALWGTEIFLLNFVIGGLLAGFSLWLIFRTLFRRRGWKPASAQALVGAICICASFVIFSVPQFRALYGVAKNHSYPWVHWMSALARRVEGNDFASLQPFIPVVSRENQPHEQPQHVLLIVMESLRSDRLSLHSHAVDTTPFLRNHAADWLSFPNYFSSAPMTSIAFAGILASRYLGPSLEREKVAELARSFWRDVRSAGYHTAFISSADIDWGGLKTLFPKNDIETFISYEESSPQERQRYHFPGDVDNSLQDKFALEKYLEFLKTAGSEGHDKTFALLYLTGVHFPYRGAATADEANDPYIATIEGFTFLKPGAPRVTVERQYDNAVKDFDALLKTLVHELEARRNLERTLIIVTGDHGESLGERGVLFHGHELGNEQIHVPLLLRVGRDFSGLQRILFKNKERLGSHFDLAPTIYDSIGLAPNTAHQGASFLTQPTKQYELVPYSYLSSKVALITKEDHFIYDLDTWIMERYQRVSDPLQLNNLWSGQSGSLAAFLEKVTCGFLKGLMTGAQLCREQLPLESSDSRNDENLESQNL